MLICTTYWVIFSPTDNFNGHLSLMCKIKWTILLKIVFHLDIRTAVAKIIKSQIIILPNAFSLEYGITQEYGKKEIKH